VAWVTITILFMTWGGFHPAEKIARPTYAELNRRC
jgi:hypothetical protein